MDVRNGPAGWWDRLVGPGASKLENAGAIGLAAAGALFGDRRLAPRAPLWQRVLLRGLALDLWGGAWVNNTPTSVAWYERAGQGAREHIGFAALHLAHPAAIASVDRGGGRVAWAAGHYAWMLGSAAVIAASPRRARLAIATGASVAGVALDRRLGPSAAAPWFAPVYYAKLLIGHAAGSVWNR